MTLKRTIHRREARKRANARREMPVSPSAARLNALMKDVYVDSLSDLLNERAPSAVEYFKRR